VLAQFVLVVFALFAVLSLVIDVGYARITQAEMQNAAVGENEFSGDRRVAAPEKVSDLRSRVGDR